MLQQKLSVSLGKAEHFRGTLWSKVLYPSEHPIGCPGHAEGMIVVLIAGPAVIGKPLMAIHHIYGGKGTSFLRRGESEIQHAFRLGHGLRIARFPAIEIPAISGP